VLVGGPIIKGISGG